MTADASPSLTVIEQFDLDAKSIAPLTGGLINASFGAVRRGGGAVVLQRVNPIFPPAVNDDIDAITRHLNDRGLTTPLLIPTREGRNCLEHNGAVWRLLTRIDGATYEALSNDRQAAEAGRVLGSFQAALVDYAAPLANRRPPVHDLPRHLENLRLALVAHADHAAHAGIAVLAAELYALARELGPLPDLPERLVHGDPKISNIVFAGEQAVCLVDLDTITRIPAPLELGDAIRSWCNVEAEDSPQAAFSLERFSATIAGFGRGAPALLTPAEWQAVPQAAITIAIELAARFAADALNESYFGWDRRRYASASAHNLARADAQLKLARSMLAARSAMDELVMTQA